MELVIKMGQLAAMSSTSQNRKSYRPDRVQEMSRNLQKSLILLHDIETHDIQRQR